MELSVSEFYALISRYISTLEIVDREDIIYYQANVKIEFNGEEECNGVISIYPTYRDSRIFDLTPTIGILINNLGSETYIIDGKISSTDLDLPCKLYIRHIRTTTTLDNKQITKLLKNCILVLK